MKSAILILMLIAVCLPAFAAGRLATDPNASAAAVQKTAEIDDTDARLLQKVTISESRKLVSAILDDLTRSTGVVFKAGYNNNDWQVRDRKMCAFAKDVPLAAIMNSIAHVMKFKWERKGDEGKWQYRLYMDRRTLLDADAQKLREDERIRAKAARKRKAALDGYKNVDSLSPADLAKLRDKDPLLYILGTTGVAGSMGQMFREVPALNEAMATGQEITMTGADMSEQGRAGLGRLATSILNLVRTLMPNENGIPATIDPAKAIIAVNRDLERQTGGMPQYILLGMFDVKLGDNMQTNLPLLSPDSAIGRVLGNALIKCTEGQAKIEDLNKNIEADMPKAAASDMESMKTDYGEPETQHPDDPALKAKVELKPDGTKLADIQRALAEASSYVVISDSFGKNEVSGGLVVKGENELGAMLDKLCKAAMYNWDKKASVLEFRDREWFRKRSAQIPEVTLEGWRQALKKTGTLDIDDLAEIARLDQEQYNMNVAEDEVLSGADPLNSVIWLHRDLLRLYGSLSDDQRAAILSDSGLDLGALTAEQYAATAKMLQTRDSKYLQKPDAQVTLKIARKQDGKQFHYTLSATSEGASPITETFTTPKYQEPKPPVKPADKAKPADSSSPTAGPAK